MSAQQAAEAEPPEKRARPDSTATTQETAAHVEGSGKPAAAGQQLPPLPYAAIRLIFTDLDGTLYPGSHEEEPKADKPGLMRNMAAAALLAEAGVPIVPATGNNVGFAQAKLLDPRDGSKLRDLSTMPGIYCNGALVKGAGGKEVDVRHLGEFLPRFVKRFVAPPADGAGVPPRCGDMCVGGLGKDKTLFMQWDGLSAVGRRTALEFTSLMMIEEADYKWLEPDAFCAAAETVLSLIILLPNEAQPEADDLKLAMQAWLHSADLLKFDDAAGRLSNGDGDGVVCKHVHVPGIGAEIDISPTGINKGSAILKLMEDTLKHLGIDQCVDSEVAVFGDAGNDIELFGMKRDRSGEQLVPLGLGFRPVIRCAMPWANDDLLIKDANVQATCDAVFSRILLERGTVVK